MLKGIFMLVLETKCLYLFLPSFILIFLLNWAFISLFWLILVLTSGGLPDEADEPVVRAAFIPFGEIINIEIPPDYENPAKHRGFAFIEYELAEDAAAAIDNMVHAGNTDVWVHDFL